MPYDSRYDQPRGRHAAPTPAQGLPAVNGRSYAPQPPRGWTPAAVALLAAFAVVAGVVVLFALWPPAPSPASAPGGVAIEGSVPDEPAERFGDVARWAVGDQIVPGSYVNTDATELCRWELAGEGIRGRSSGQGAKPERVELRQTGALFTSSGCGEWVRR